MPDVGAKDQYTALRTHLAATLDSTWRLSNYAQEDLGKDSRGNVHKAWSVGMPSSTPIGTTGRGENGATRLKMSTDTLVSFLFRLRAADQDGDYGEALGEEVELLKAVMAYTGASHVHLTGIPTRRLVGDGTYLRVDLRFQLKHGYTVG